MDNTIFFNINQFITYSFNSLKDDIEFVFEKHILNEDKVEQVFARIDLLCILLNKIIEPKYFQLNDLESLFLKQIKGTILSISNSVDFAYSKNKIDENNSWPACISIESLVSNYYLSEQLLNNYLFKKDNQNIFVPIDLINILEHFNFKIKKNPFNLKNPHKTIQSFEQFSTYLRNFLSFIKTNDIEIQNSISKIQEKLKHQISLMDSCYPNNYFEQEKFYLVIEDIFHIWKDIKENDISDLKNYLNSISFEFQPIRENISPEKKELLENKQKFVNKIKSVL
jgi:hypothetical protein